jgi:uncharacterized repeat protein (TIGR03803 family)
MERVMEDTKFAKSERCASISIALMVMMATIFTFPTRGMAQTESVIYSFTGGGDGYSPQSSLIFDGAGNLYGTTTFGATNNCPDFGAGCGVVFELSPNGIGGWTRGVIHTFTGGAGGGEPYAGLTLDATGNLYGTATVGGTSTNCTGGCGVVFKLTSNGSGGWSYGVIHSFDSSRGANPRAGVVFDISGNLYGVTYEGGSAGYGVAYKLSPTGGGGWGETVLHNFTIGADGGWPNSLLIDGSSGILYGTTYLGGKHGNCSSSGCGVVFQIAPGNGGFHLIYSFQGLFDGGNPSGLAEDGSKNLYVASSYGGDLKCYNFGCGTVVELSPSGTGWTKSMIHIFGRGSDGKFPQAGPTLDGSGNIYGTTANGGAGGAGVLFELSLAGSVWNESILYSFDNGTGGGYPFSGVVLDGLGNIYGQTNSGGIPGDCSDFLGCGVVYEVTP